MSVVVGRLKFTICTIGTYFHISRYLFFNDMINTNQPDKRARVRKSGPNQMCFKDSKCCSSECPYEHSEERLFCPDGARCADDLCSRGRHPALCPNSYYCPDRNSTCSLRHLGHQDHAALLDKKNPGLVILVEPNNLLACISGRDDGDSVIELRAGALDFVRWLKVTCRTSNVRAAFYTDLPPPEADRMTHVLDPDNVLHVYGAQFNKDDPSVELEAGRMRDLVTLWGSAQGPAAPNCPYSTIVIDNNCRKMREFPNNLVYVPPFVGNAKAISSEEGQDTFHLGCVSEYLDIVVQEWLGRSREKLKNKDIRKMLYFNLSPSIRREGRILLLLDLNGTLMYRSMDELQSDKPFSKHPADRRKCLYFRPFAEEFVAYLLEKQKSGDCIDVAFYSSMTMKNASFAAEKLDSSRKIYVYPRDFNKPDRSSDSAHAVIRDLPAVWNAPASPGFGHSPLSTIMIDDTCRKLREYPLNLLQVS